MKDLGTKIHQTLGARLNAEGFDLVDLVPIPAHGDRMLRFRTVQEALEEFESDGSMGYLVQIRRQAPAVSAPAADTSALEGVWMPDGKLNVQYLVRNAELLFSAGEFTLAGNIYKSLLDAGVNSGFSLYWMGRCLEAEGKSEEACHSYEEALTWNPTLEAYRHFGGLLIRSRKNHQAAEIYERALNLKTLSADTRFELHKTAGNCWMRAEKDAQAEKHYRQALQINPSADDIQANLGALYLQGAKTSDARRFFQDALAANPANDRALSGLGSCWLADGDRQQAHDAFAKSLEINLANPTAVFHLVKCAYQIRSYATAARILGEYVQTAPVSTNLLYSLAGLQFHLGQHGEAAKTARQILDMKAGHAGAADLLKLIHCHG